MQHRFLLTMSLALAVVLIGSGGRANVSALPPGKTPAEDAQKSLGILHLERFGIETTVPSLRKALHHEDEFARRGGLHGLALIGSEADIDAVKPLLNDPEPSVRMVAISTLQRLSYRMASNPRSALMAELRTAVRKLFQTAPNKWGRMEYAGLLADLGDLSEARTLLEALEDKAMRTYAMRARALQLLEPFLDHAAANRGEQAIDWTKPLADILNDESNTRYVRTLAVSALKRLNTPRSREILETAQGRVKDDMLRRMIKWSLPVRSTGPGSQPPTSP